MKSFLLAGLTSALLSGCAGQHIGDDAGSGDEVTHELTGTRWALIELSGRRVVLEEQQREPYIVLESAAQRIAGYAGCNRLDGRYEIVGHRLTLSALTTPRTSCAYQSTQDELMRALEATSSWRISGARLELFDGTRRITAAFNAANL